ncbi:sensor histidine kinase [Haloimpatiens sp. FM7315]|uniref:sensor histidine kinase n=1 Tax=Haloimpatiens sp. FM7315 TaxID=3298609 RepID=UPI0035A29DDE
MKFKNKTSLLMLLILLQNVVVMFFTNNVLMSYNNIKPVNFKYPLTLPLIVDILGISSIICVVFIIDFVKKERRIKNELNSSKEIIDALKGQKHDFQNHLSIISGLIQLGKSEKALDYTFNICGKTNEIFSISKISNTEVAALLYKKHAIAESKGITVELDIDSFLDNVKIDSIDLCKILFNLIDNAIEGLQNCSEDKKILSIATAEVGDTYSIAISNSFPILSKSVYSKLFEIGYSTKKGNNHGHGLPIVKHLVEKNKGNLTVESYEGVGTIFTVFLPKNVL